MNLLQTVARYYELTPTEWGVLEWDACRKSFRYWLQHYGVMVDESSGTILRGITLWPGQEPFIAALEAGDNIISGKARQTGWSWLAGNYDYWEMEFRDNIRLAIIDVRDDDAMKHIERIKQIHMEQPPWIARKPVTKGFSSKHEYAIGARSKYSIITSYPCIESAGRGIAARRVRLEEFAYWPNAEEVYTALRATAGDAGRQVVILSTANGEGNKYHELWLAAVEGRVSYIPIFIGWDAHPDRDQAWYDSVLADLGLAYMKQEFPSTPEEMFISSGSRFFDIEFMAWLESQYAMQPIRTAYGATWRIFEEPVAGHNYVLGGDVADGGDDASYGYIVDTETNHQVATLHSYDWSADEFADHLYAAGELYNWAYLIIERNNMGSATLATLIRALQYPAARIHRHQHWDPTANALKPRAGWVTTSQSRPSLLTDFRRAIGSGHIPRDAELYKQARAFGYYNNRWDHPKGGHDDAVFGGGLAIQGMRHAISAQANQDIVIYQDGEALCG